MTCLLGSWLKNVESAVFQLIGSRQTLLGFCSVERPKCSHQEFFLKGMGLLMGCLGTCVLRVQGSIAGRCLNEGEVEESFKEEVLSLVLKNEWELIG